MKLSLIPLNFGREMLRDRTMSTEDWIRMAVELGLDGTEMYEAWVQDMDASGMARLADVVHDAGLQVSQYTYESDFSRPERREQAVAHCKQAVDRALVFGANIVRVTAAAPHDPVDRDWVLSANKEDVIQSCAKGLKACLDYAEEKQVMLALEDHWLIGTNVPDFMRILELVDDNRLKVNLDTANVPRDSTVELAKLVADRVVHLHVSELLEGKHGIVIGKGDVDIKGVFSVLKGASYDGWVSLEALAGTKEDLRFSIEYVRNEWNSA
ncbi:MAG: sugar phosphate isomerase/epimerase family protein [Candidatus Thorarchaeota archaeon]